MSLKKYLILMIISTGVCWVSFLFVLFTLDPQAGVMALLLFYLSLSLSLLGTFFIIGFLARSLLKRQLPPFRHLGISFRQALLFTLLVIGSLVLQAGGLLRWWNILIFLVCLIIFEFFFSLKKTSYGR